MNSLQLLVYTALSFMYGKVYSHIRLYIAFEPDDYEKFMSELNFATPHVTSIFLHIIVTLYLWDI